MDASTIVTNVQELTPLQLLEKVDSFYNNAWIKLIIFVTILIALVGIVIPFLVQWFQRRFFILREDKIKNELREYCCSFKKEIGDEVYKNINKNLEEIKGNIMRLEDEIRKEIKCSRSLPFHVQGLMRFKENEYELALRSYLHTIEGYVEGDDQVNLQTVLDQIVFCLDNLSGEDLENIQYDGYDIDKKIELLEKNNKGGKLTHFINKFKASFSKAKQRKKVEGKK